MSLSLLSYFWPATLLALFACHHAPRDNPFDPALTPPVELQVALDDTAGIATLTWTRYEGQQPFREYRVLRNIAEHTRVDTLAVIPQVEQTTFADTTLEPNTAYAYRVAVVNAAGYETPSEERSVAGFSVGTVRLLGVESDPQAGTLALRWNRYVGPDFARYQLHRRPVGTDREEILAQIPAPTDTTFADQTAQAGVEYVYTVVVEAAGQTLLSNTQETKLDLPPVAITRADFVSAEASASLAWTRYQGPRFKAYQVLRRTEELAAQPIAEKPDLADTSLVDLGLIGNTGYFYQVVVLTERDEGVKSEEKRGIFHQLLATWPIELEEGGSRLFVHLYQGEEGISALVSGQYPTLVTDFHTLRVKLLLFDGEGQRLEEQLPVQGPFGYGLPVDSPQGLALASSADGRRFLSEASGSVEMGVLSWAADGQQLAQDLPLFGDAFPQPLSGPEAVVLGEIALVGGGGFETLGGAFDSVAVWAQGHLLFADGFQGPTKGWSYGKGFLRDGILYFHGASVPVARRADTSWQNFRLEADALSMEWARGPVGIQIGGDTFSRLALWLDRENQQAILDWSFTPPSDLNLEPRTQRFTVPLGVLGGPVYHLGLEMVDGQVRASVRSPLRWGGLRPPGLPWTGLATIGDILALTLYDQPYALTQEGEATPFSSFGSGVSEIRAWENRQGRQQVGVCLPEAGKLLLGLVPGGQEAQWPTFLIRNLGPNIGAQQGLLSYPLSFDVGPDGRIFVLDAGSGRILVFDVNRQYLTQWGRRGSGAGEFSFGEGDQAVGGGLNFAGSIAVDNQGFIYVADELNQRIQKFAP